MNLNQYRVALDLVSQGMLRTVLGLVRQLFTPGSTPAEVRAVLAPVLVAEVRARRGESYRLAAEFLRAQAAAQGVPNPYIPAQDGYPVQAVDTVLRENLRGSPEEAANAVAGVMVRHVEDSARRTVVRAVEDEVPAKPEREPSIGTPDDKPVDARAMSETEGRQSGAMALLGTPEYSGQGTRRAKSYARVLTGADNCSFCVMLASRGPVYESADTAGRQDAFEKWPDAKGYINSYHDNCDCVVVPIYSYAENWSGKDQYKRLEKLWKDSTKGFYGRDAMNALGRELSRMEREGEQLPVDDLRAA